MFGWISGTIAVIAIALAIRWAWKNHQFDEDIKYLVFTESDKDKMSPEDYKRWQEVMKAQTKD